MKLTIASLRASIPQVKQVWLADDSAGGGSIGSLYQLHKSLCEEGRKFGYIVNGAKSWLIVKTSELAESAKKVFGDEVNITLEGRRYLGAVIGSKDLRINIVKRKLISASEKWSPSRRSARASPTLPISLSLKDLNPNSLITCAPSNHLKSMWTPSKK